MTARSERPIRRLISWVRPPIRPFTDSRSDRVLVEAGSIAYSAVTQPRPDPFRQRGTPSEADAAHSTRVRPNSTSTEPAAWSSQPRVIVIGRSSSSARPSSRGVVMRTTLEAGVSSLELDAQQPLDAEEQRDDQPDGAGHQDLQPLLPARRVVALE